MARLTALRSDGALTGAHVRLAAESMGVTERTVWRWLAASAPAAKPRRRGSYTLSATDLAAFQFYRGNVAAVARAREAVVDGDGTTAGAPVPEVLAEGWAAAAPVTERTLLRAFNKELTPAELAAWRTGETGRRAAQVYLKRPDALRGRVWEMDHKQLPLMVLPPRGAAVCPWVTTIVDDGTRALVGWAIALYPNAGTVLTAMRMALLRDPERGDFGAVPERVRMDRGLEFAAESVESVLGALVVATHRLPAFKPHRKGKVERVNLTIEQTLLSGLPGYTRGPRDAAGKLYGPVGDSIRQRAAAEATGDAMRIERFVDRFKAWVTWYNTERPHRMIGKRTPAQAWAEDTAALHRIGPDQLRHLLLADAERIIGKEGIRHQNLYYLAPELSGRGGQRVQIRYMPHDDRFVEVFLDGQHLCTAVPTNQMTEAETDAYRAHQREESKRLGAERRAASRRARRELAPMTGDEPAADSRLIPKRAGHKPGRAAADAALRRSARTDLLNLRSPTGSQPSPEP